MDQDAITQIVAGLLGNGAQLMNFQNPQAGQTVAQPMSREQELLAALQQPLEVERPPIWQTLGVSVGDAMKTYGQIAAGMSPDSISMLDRLQARRQQQAEQQYSTEQRGRMLELQQLTGERTREEDRQFREDMRSREIDAADARTERQIEADLARERRAAERGTAEDEAKYLRDLQAEARGLGINPTGMTPEQINAAVAKKTDAFMKAQEEAKNAPDPKAAQQANSALDILIGAFELGDPNSSIQSFSAMKEGGISRASAERYMRSQVNALRSEGATETKVREAMSELNAMLDEVYGTGKGDGDGSPVARREYRNLSQDPLVAADQRAAQDLWGAYNNFKLGVGNAFQGASDFSANALLRALGLNGGQ